jgi:rhodanese-related sulfurtransferase
MMQTILPSELQKILTNNPSANIFDVRTPPEFAEVHVPQTKNIPLDESNPNSLSLDKISPFIYYAAAVSAPQKPQENLRTKTFHNQ